MGTLRTSITTVVFLLFFCLSAQAQEDQAPPGEPIAQRVVGEIVHDREAKTITYTVHHPSYIRVRAGIADGPLYLTLVNWKKQEPGTYTVGYTGLDTEKAVYTLHYFTEGDEDARGLRLSEILPHPAQLAVGKALPATQITYLQKNLDRGRIYDPPLKLDVIENKRLVIDMADEDKEWFVRERFQVHIFVDDIFVHGDLEGYLPYVWNIDTEGISKGGHTVTVNLNGFADHIAAATLSFVVE